MTLQLVPAPLKDISSDPKRVNMSPPRCDGNCYCSSVVSIVDVPKVHSGFGAMSRTLPWISLCEKCSQAIGRSLTVNHTWSAFCMTWVTVAWASLVGRP